MKYTLFFLLYLSLKAFALPPIEGGEAVPLESFEYIDIVRLETPLGDSCTGTKIAVDLVITAAHCVLDTFNGLEKKHKVGTYYPRFGKLKSVHAHPSFRKAWKEKRDYIQIVKEDKDIRKNEKLHRAKMKELSGKFTLYDVAILRFETKKKSRNLPFPGIISKDTKLGPRKVVNMVGYGDLEMYWNGESFVTKSNFTEQQMLGTNEWASCPKSLINENLETIEQFANDALNTLSVKSLRTHTIANNVEHIDTHGTAMILKGDSGSPALERDKSGKLVITGIASNTEQGRAEGSRASLKIYKNGALLSESELDNFPDNWGYAGKNDTEFPEIIEKLRELGVKDSSEVHIERVYKRATIGNYADLSHPENQAFIASVLEAKP